MVLPRRGVCAPPFLIACTPRVCVLLVLGFLSLLETAQPPLPRRRRRHRREAARVASRLPPAVLATLTFSAVLDAGLDRTPPPQPFWVSCCRRCTHE